MPTLTPNSPKDIIHDVILPNGDFPNNAKLPLLIYKQVFELIGEPEQVQQLLKLNHWLNSWVNSIYDYDHYHSNTHETLVILQGHCLVQIGGPDYKKYEIKKGDVIIFPAGVAHKNLNSSADFKCVGAYPIDIDYDMHYGRPEEHPKVDDNIKQVKLPSCDPVFGVNGQLFDYWHD